MATTSVPLRVIDVSALATDRCINRLREHVPAVPGAVDHGESTTAWTSSRHAAYPQELGLCVLSKTQCILKGLRVMVEEHFRAPSKIEVFYATSAVSHNSSRDDNRRLDPVSRYFSAQFVQLSDTIEWPISTLCSCRETRLDLPHCAFLKLLIYQPHRHADNINNQVSIQEIELLGMIQPIDVNMHQNSLQSSNSLDHDECSTELETSMPGDCDDKELHVALLKAGVALDIVKKVMALPSDEAEIVISEGPRHKEQHFEVAAESEPSNSEHQTIATVSDSLHCPAVTESLGTCEQYSVFDRAVRDEIARMMDEDETFNQIIRRNKDAKPSSKYSALQLFSDMAFRVGLFPKIQAEDRGNLIEIIMYTFGSLFTEYLLCDFSEIRALCIMIAERFLPTLKEATGVVVVYEGSLALLRVSFQDSDLGVFQACLHLAQTLFQQLPVKTSLPQAFSLFGSTIGIVSELPESYVKYGLRLVTKAILANPCCWTKEHHQFNASTFRKKRINLDFLRFVRLLISQETVRYSFYQVLLPVEHISSGNQIVEGGSEQSIHLVETSNRLRLFRLLLQWQKASHVTIPADIRKQIDHFCKALSYRDTPTSTTASSSSVCRLAADCLHLLHANTASRLKPFNFMQLNKVHTQVDELEMEGSTAHDPRFVQFAIASEQQALLQDQTRRYFHLRPRPRALYQHSFSHDNLEGQSKYFQKGNIEFRGEMEERNPGNLVAFHELVAQNTQPYTFNLGSKNWSTAEAMHSGQLRRKEISTPFATFKGTVEARTPTTQPVSTTTQRISDRTTATHELAPFNSSRQSDSPSASAKLKATGSDPTTDNSSSDSSNALDPQTKIRISNSTLRISSAAPGSSSHHSAAVGDILPSQIVTSTVVPAQPLQAQHPKTAPAGGKQRSTKEADANGGCTLQ